MPITHTDAFSKQLTNILVMNIQRYEQAGSQVKYVFWALPFATCNFNFALCTYFAW